MTSAGPHEAGRRLGWKPITKVVGERLLVIDDQDVPGEVYARASSNAADRMDEFLRPPRHRPVDDGS